MSQVKVIFHNICSAEGRLGELEREYRDLEAEVIFVAAHRQRNFKLLEGMNYFTKSLCDAVNTHASIAVALSPGVQSRLQKVYESSDSRALGVEFQLKGQRRLLVIGYYRNSNGHKEAVTATTVKKQLEVLSTIIRRSGAAEVLVLGDFNLHLQGRAAIDRELDSWLLRHNLLDQEKQRRPTFTQIRLGKSIYSRVDYAFAGPMMSLDCWIGEDRCGSDHFPVICSVKISPDRLITAPPPSRAIPFSEQHVEQYQQAIINREAELGADTVTTVMIEAAQRTMQPRRGNQVCNSRPKYGKEIAVAVRKRARLRRAWNIVRRSGLDSVDRTVVTPVEWGKLRAVERDGVCLPPNKSKAEAWRVWAQKLDTLVRELDTLIREGKARWEQRRLQRLVEHADDEYRRTGYVSQQLQAILLGQSKLNKLYIRSTIVKEEVQPTIPSHPPTAQQVLHTEPDTVRNDVNEHFSSWWKPVLAEKEQLLFNEMQSEADWQEDLMASITVEMIDKRLKLMPKHKAPGRDGLTVRHYQALPACAKRAVAEKLTHWLNVEQSPFETYVVPILKSGDPRVLDNLRPIALTPILWRILAGIITERIRDTMERCLSKMQQAFLPGTKLTEHLTLMTNIVEHAIHTKSPLYVAKLDLRKAYDSVEFWVLDKALRRLRLPQMMIDFLVNTRRTKLYVETAFGETEPVDVRRGLLQGDPLSPLLFCAVMDPLLTALEQDPNGYRWGVLLIAVLAFADDLLLMASSPAKLQVLLDTATRFFSDIGIQLNYEKCRGYCTGATCDDSAPVYLNHTDGVQLQFAARHEPLKYLGVSLSLTGENSAATDAVERDLRHMSVLLQANRHRLSPDVMTYIVNTCFEPKIRYRLGTVLTWQQMDEVRRHFVRTARSALGLPYWLCLEALLLPGEEDGVGIADVRDRWLKTTTKMILDLLCSGSKAGQSCLLRLEEIRQHYGWPAHPLCLDMTLLKQYRHVKGRPEWLVDLALGLAEVGCAIHVPRVSFDAAAGVGPSDLPSTSEPLLDTSMKFAVNVSILDTCCNHFASRSLQICQYLEQHCDELSRWGVQFLSDLLIDDLGHLIRLEDLDSTYAQRYASAHANMMRFYVRQALQEEAIDSDVPKLRPDLLEQVYRFSKVPDVVCLVDRQTGNQLSDVPKELRSRSVTLLRNARIQHENQGRLFRTIVPADLVPLTTLIRKSTQFRAGRDPYWRIGVCYAHNAMPTYALLTRVNNSTATDQCPRCNLNQPETQEHIFGLHGCPFYQQQRMDLCRELQSRCGYGPEEVRSLMNPMPFVPRQALMPTVPQAQAQVKRLAASIIKNYVVQVWSLRSKSAGLTEDENVFNLLPDAQYPLEWDDENISMNLSMNVHSECN